MSTGPDSTVSEQELLALVDGELAAERSAEVARLVAAEPELSARVAAYRQQNQALRGEFDRMLAEPVPPALLEFATAKSRRAAPGWASWQSWAIAASLLAAVGVGGLGGWFGRSLALERLGLPVSFASQAAVIHAVYSREQRHPVEVWAAEEQHLVAWLSKRLGEQLKAPNLAEFGFSLVGGRLVAAHRQPSAMFMYQTADGQRITLTVRRDAEDAGETGFRYLVEGSVGVFYWVDRDFGYAISGEIDRAQLLTVARSVYGQLAGATARR